MMALRSRLNGSAAMRLVVCSAFLSLILLTAFGVSAAADHASPPLHDSNDPVPMSAAAPVTGPWYIDRLDRPIIGSGSDRGKYVSIAMRYKETFISYYDATDKNLRVAHRYENNANTGNCGSGDGWWCDVVDSNGDVGQWSSIAAAPYSTGVRFGIAYYDATNHALKFATYNCYSAPCTVTPVTIAPLNGGSAGMYTSAKYDYNGVVHIAYQEVGSDTSLYYAHSVASGGNCGGGGASGKWWCDKIDTGLGIGQYASLDLNGSNEPRIAYYDAINKHLKYASLVGSGHNCGPNGTWECDTIDDVDDVGRFVSLHQGPGDYPSIAYYDATKGKLKYAERAELPGNCGPLFQSYHLWQCDVIADMGIGITQPNQSAGISIEVVPSAGPVIAYMDGSDLQGPSALSVARARRIETGAAHNCGPAGKYVWWCEALDGGGSWTNEASYVAMAADYNGRLSIAYYESDDYYDTGYMKFANQALKLYQPLLAK